MNMPPEHNEPLSQKNKGLLALVIFLGVLIVVATTVLIFMIVSRIIHGRPQSTTQSTIQSTHVMSVDRPVSVLQEPEGTHIVSITRQSDQMMVILLNGGGKSDRLVVWDVAHQQKISEIKLAQ